MLCVLKFAAAKRPQMTMKKSASQPPPSALRASQRILSDSVLCGRVLRARIQWSFSFFFIFLGEKVECHPRASKEEKTLHVVPVLRAKSFWTVVFVFYYYYEQQ
jgi:hypothetical protein